ncbi:MAG TPA: tripartite tricarboxylate transporter substrate binding protein [Chloroflexota bacterium]|nr:tripartite tricarboxylate transporter substrate binding protein [Chloroflexota bacterium]
MRKTHLWFGIGLVAVLLLTLALSGCRASEAKYPSRPVTMAVGASAGSPQDLQGRVLAKASEKLLKSSISVENRAGGGGAEVFNYVKDQPADGYAVGMTTRSSVYILARPDLPAKSEDFEWIIRLTSDPTAIIVRPDSQFKTIEDLIQYAKANPGKIKIGGALTGGINQAMMELFSTKAGIKMTWVAFDGASQATTAALGGQVDAIQMTPGSAVALLTEGKLKALGVTSDKRLSYMPDSPTFKERGIDMVEYNWRGAFVKKGTPPEIVKTLHDTFKQAMDAPEWKDYVTKNKQEETYMNTADFNKAIVTETESAKAFLKQIGTIK